MVSNNQSVCPSTGTVSNHELPGPDGEAPCIISLNCIRDPQRPWDKGALVLFEGDF